MHVQIVRNLKASAMQWIYNTSIYSHIPASHLRIKIFRAKMNLIPQKDKVKLDAWTTKSMLSFVKMKTHKNLGSHVPLTWILWELLIYWNRSAKSFSPKSTY